jgi:hypothetical protein
VNTIQKDNVKQKDRADNRKMAAALDYAANGIPVFPCRPTKEPLTTNGFKDATTNESQIQEWWNKWPNAMIGMPTGAASGIVVIDIDVKPDEGINGHEFLPNWKTLSAAIAETPSGGHHLYVRSNDQIRCTTDVIAAGVDTRGEGGYVIVPPSSNAAGRYKFIKDADVYLQDSTKLPPFPAELLAKLGAPHTGWGGDTPEADPERVAAAMAVVPNPDLGWEDWKKFGMAIWRATGGAAEGFTIFDDWSQKSEKYNDTNTKRAWDQITRSPPTRIGAGTIFHHANKADPSWASDGALVLPVGAPLVAAETFMERCCSASEIPLLWFYRGASIDGRARTTANTPTKTWNVISMRSSSRPWWWAEAACLRHLIQTNTRFPKLCTPYGEAASYRVTGTHRAG